MQSDVVVSDTEITGTLKYVTGYTDFSSETSEQSGNYLVLKFAVTKPDTTTTVEIIGGTKGPVQLDDDMNIVLLIRNKDTQSIKVTIKNGTLTASKVYGITGLTLQPSV